MYSRSPIFFAFLFLLSINTNAQQEFVNALLVTNTLDTLRGYVAKRNGPELFTVCMFKKKLDGQTIEYHAEDIYAYYTTSNGMMVSQSVSMEQGTIQVFLKRLVNGKCRLYKYESAKEVYFFIQMSDGPLDQLIVQTDESPDGRPVRKPSNQFKVQLQKLFSDCSGMTEPLAKVTSSEEHLVSVVSAYNNCTGDPIRSQAPKEPWTITHFGILAGASYTSFSPVIEPFTGPYSVLVNEPYKNTVSFHAGAFIDFDFVRRRLNQSFRVDLLYFRAHYEGSATYPWGTRMSEVDIQQFKVPLSFRQAIGKSSTKPYFLLGASLSVYLDAKSTLVRSITGTGTTTYENTYTFSKNPLGFFAGFGVKSPLSDKISVNLELRGELTAEINNVSMSAGIAF